MPARIAQHAADNARGGMGRAAGSANRAKRAPVEPKVDVVEAEPVGRDAAAGRSVAESSHARLPLPPLRALHCADSRGPRLARGLVLDQDQLSCCVLDPGSDVAGASPVPVKIRILPGSTSLSLSPGADVAGPKAEACLVRRRRRIRRVRAEHCRHHTGCAQIRAPRDRFRLVFAAHCSRADGRSSMNPSLRRAAVAKRAKPSPTRARTVPTPFAEVDAANVRHCLPCHIRPS
jgi:hypothetical protein